MSTEQLHATHIQQARHAWDSIADGYDEVVTPINLDLATRALGRLDLRPGMKFLDIAAGTGALGIAAARTGADVLAADISPRMIELLDARARQEGLTNLRAQVMDGHDLQIDDDSFDVAGSVFGVMLFPDLPRGLREMIRVTRPGGTVLMVTFGSSPDNIEFISWFIAAVQQVVPEFAGLPTDPPPLPFQCANPANLRQQLIDAGATAVTVDPVTAQLEIASATHLMQWLANSNPIGAALVGGLSREQHESVSQVLDGMLRERSGGNGPALLDGPINIAVATV